MNKVSAIRLDREGRTSEMAADDPNRSPINPEGIVSVDLAAIGDRADTPSGKIANYIMKSSEALCFAHPPQFDQGYTTLTRSSRRRQNFLRQLNNRRAA